jgi:site-specific DNA-methyltransferase (cytosine-N4-specific)
MRCAKAGLKPHPARFPTTFAAFFIEFLTEPDDVILDPFAGSNTTGFVAERLNRRWVSIEMNEQYLRGAKLRFEAAEPSDSVYDPTDYNLVLQENQLCDY